MPCACHLRPLSKPWPQPLHPRGQGGKVSWGKEDARGLVGERKDAREIVWEREESAAIHGGKGELDDTERRKRTRSGSTPTRGAMSTKQRREKNKTRVQRELCDGGDEWAECRPPHLTTYRASCWRAPPRRSAPCPGLTGRAQGRAGSQPTSRQKPRWRPLGRWNAASARRQVQPCGGGACRYSRRRDLSYPSRRRRQLLVPPPLPPVCRCSSGVRC